MSSELNAIINFVQERFFNVFDFELNAKTSIEDDLAITGMDAVELIVDFGKRFNVDVSRFMAAEYFASEGSSIFSIWSSKPPKKITLGHLEKAIKAGRLDEEIING